MMIVRCPPAPLAKYADFGIGHAPSPFTQNSPP